MKTPLTLTTLAIAVGAAAAVTWPAGAAQAATMTRSEVVDPVRSDSRMGIRQANGEIGEPIFVAKTDGPRARDDVKREVLQAAARGELVGAVESHPLDAQQLTPRQPSRLYARRAGQ